MGRAERGVAGLGGVRRYGFSPGPGTVRVELSDGGTVELSFGGPAPGERRVYARTSLHPDVVLVVDTALRASVDRGSLDLRDRRLWRLDAERIVSVEVADGENGVTVERAGRRFLVTPPGVAADFERASRLFDVVSAPRAAGFPVTRACSAAPGLRIRVVGEDGAAHELRMGSASAGAVAACLDGNTPVALSADLAAMARELSADLGRTSLLPAFDPLSVTSIAVTSAAERWTLRRGPEGWRSDDGALSPDADTVRRWIRPLVLLQVDPARVGEGPFETERTIDLSSRIGSTIRLQVSAAARDGGVLVRRWAAAVAFRLAPAEAAFLTAVRAYLPPRPGRAIRWPCRASRCWRDRPCRRDPAKPRRGQLLNAGPRAMVARGRAARRCRGRGSWSATSPVARAAMIPRAALEPDVRWTVVLRRRRSRDPAAGGVRRGRREGPFAAAGYGSRASHAAGARRAALRGVVAPDWVGGVERCVDPGDVAPWSSTPRDLASRGRFVDSVDDSRAPWRSRWRAWFPEAGDPSADWPRRFAVRCESASGTSSFVVGGPDDQGRVLLWSEQHGALLQTQPRVHAALGYLAALGPR